MCGLSEAVVDTPECGAVAAVVREELGATTDSEGARSPSASRESTSARHGSSGSSDPERPGANRTAGVERSSAERNLVRGDVSR